MEVVGIRLSSEEVETAPAEAYAIVVLVDEDYRLEVWDRRYWVPRSVIHKVGDSLGQTESEPSYQSPDNDLDHPFPVIHSRFSPFFSLP